jgi:hypothetical protein
MVKQYTQEQVDRGDTFGLEADTFEVVGADGKPLVKEDEDDAKPTSTGGEGGGEQGGGEGGAKKAEAADGSGDGGDGKDAKADDKTGGEGEGESFELVADVDGKEVVVIDKDGKVVEEYKHLVPEDHAIKTDDNKPGDEGADDKGGHLLPKQRYDHQKARADRFESENEQLRQQLEQMKQAPTPTPTPAPAPAPAADAAAAESDRLGDMLKKNLTDAVMQKNQTLVAGDVETAARLELEIDDIRDELKSHKASKAAAVPEAKGEKPDASDASAIRQQVREELILEDAVDAAIGTYPELNESSDKFNQKLVDKLVDLQKYYVGSGRGRYEAFAEALEDLKPRLTAPEADSKKPELRKRVTDIRKNISAANAQPPTLDDKTGSNSDKAGLTDDTPDITKLSDAEFDKLPNEVKRRARGDFV